MATIATAVTITLAACSTPMSMGGADSRTVASGAAGGASSSGNDKLERCSAPVGTASFIEDTSSGWYHTLTGTYGLPSTVMVLRLLAQQSNCFIVVERNQGLKAMQGERALEQSGELRGGSSYGKGQMVSADYAIVPSITFSSNDSGGASAGLYGLANRFGAVGGVLSSVAGSVKRREAATVLALNDNRSGVQVAIAEGNASTMDIGGSAWGWGLPAAALGNLGSYSRTPQGKVLVAAFTDSFNQIVKAVKSYKPQQVQGGQRSGTGGRLQVH